VHVASALDEVRALEALVVDPGRVGHHVAFAHREEVLGSELALALATLLPRGGVEVQRRVLVADVAPERPELQPAGLRVVKHREPGRVQVHDDRGQHRVHRRAPNRSEQIRRPRHLVGQRRDGQLDSQPLETLLLPVQRQAVPVLVHHHLRHERGAHAAARDDLVAERCAHYLRLAVERPASPAGRGARHSAGTGR
jgi:hypothetical protein